MSEQKKSGNQQDEVFQIFFGNEVGLRSIPPTLQKIRRLIVQQSTDQVWRFTGQLLGRSGFRGFAKRGYAVVLPACTFFLPRSECFQKLVGQKCTLAPFGSRSGPKIFRVVKADSCFCDYFQTLSVRSCHAPRAGQRKNNGGKMTPASAFCFVFLVSETKASWRRV